MTLRMSGVEEAIQQQHRKRFNQWKAHGNVLCYISKVDSLSRHYVERIGGRLGGDLSNAFFASYSNDAQLIYKATAHVDGESKLGNGPARHIYSYLPTALEVEIVEVEFDEGDSDDYWESGRE
jgi:hypothetical protein